MNVVCYGLYDDRSVCLGLLRSARTVHLSFRFHQDPVAAKNERARKTLRGAINVTENEILCSTDGTLDNRLLLHWIVW